MIVQFNGVSDSGRSSFCFPAYEYSVVKSLTTRDYFHFSNSYFILFLTGCLSHTDGIVAPVTIWKLALIYLLVLPVAVKL